MKDDGLVIIVLLGLAGWFLFYRRRSGGVYQTLYDAQNNLRSDGSSIVIPYSDYIPSFQFSSIPLQSLDIPGMPSGGK